MQRQAAKLKACRAMKQSGAIDELLEDLEREAFDRWKRGAASEDDRLRLEGAASIVAKVKRYGGSSTESDDDAER